VISNPTTSGLELFFFLTFPYTNNQRLITDFHNVVLKLVFNGDGNYLFHNPSFPKDEKESLKTVGMALKWPQPIFSASGGLSMVIPTQPFRAHLGWIANIRNGQRCDISLLCKYFSMQSLLLLTFHCLLAQCTTIFTVASFLLLLLAQLFVVIWGKFFYRNKFTL